MKTLIPCAFVVCDIRKLAEEEVTTIQQRIDRLVQDILFDEKGVVGYERYFSPKQVIEVITEFEGNNDNNR